MDFAKNQLDHGMEEAARTKHFRRWHEDALPGRTVKCLQAAHLCVKTDIPSVTDNPLT
jgi:hypothetical protein